MADFPSLPLWTDAYLADTRHLSTLQHGAYFLLMMEAWRRPTCSLPDDDNLLARLCGLDSAAWAENRAIIMGFWKLDKRSKTFVQKRLSKEKSYVKKRSKVQKDRALKRWNVKKKTDALADAGAMPDGCPTDAPTPTPTPTPTKKEDNTPPVAARAEDHLWNAGKAFLISRGLAESRVGSVIGKWKRDYGTGAVIEALGAAQTEPNLVDPIPFITKVLRRRNTDDPDDPRRRGDMIFSSPC